MHGLYLQEKGDFFETDITDMLASSSSNYFFFRSDHELSLPKTVG